MKTSIQWIGLATCCALLLTACAEPGGQALLEDYASRVSNVLEVDIRLDLPAAAQEIPALPARRDRVLPTINLREGVIDVWNFEQCGMISIIAERNSSLGKMMLPSQKMRYEIRFFQALQDCRAQMLALPAPDESQLGFIKRLENIYKIKRQNLPAEIWNGIYNSEEMSEQFARGKPAFALNEEATGEVQRALGQMHALAKLANADPVIAPEWLDNIEDNYYAFYSNHLGARLLTTLPMLIQVLDRTATAINKRLEQEPFCYPGHRPPRANNLLNVFRKYYAGQIQPYLAQVQREGRQWLQRHDEIMGLLPAPVAMQAYRLRVVSISAEGGLWQQWQRAVRRHTQDWQDILGQCNMMPKRN